MKIDLHTPVSWQELTADQLRFVVTTALQGLRREEFLLVLFCHFTGVKMVAGTAMENNKKVVQTRFKDADGHEFELEDWKVSDFCSRLAVFFDENIPLDVAWPFKWDRYLFDTTFGNWFHADAMMLRFALEGNPEFLKKAMKDLGDKRGDIQPDDPDLVLMLRWYENFKDWLQMRYPLVFQKSKTGENEIPSPIDTRKDIMLMLNNNRPQDNEAIENSNLHDVLAALQHRIEEANHIESELKKLNQ